MGQEKHPKEEPETEKERKCSDFSIERLLREDKHQRHADMKTSPATPTEDAQHFEWLHCSRFKPPRVQRTRKRGAPISRSSRGPRIPFSPKQISLLESTFQISQYLSSDDINALANELFLTETRVKIWFQNRRARYRRESATHVPQVQHHHEHQHQRPFFRPPLPPPPPTIAIISRHHHFIPFQHFNNHHTQTFSRSHVSQKL